MTGSNITLQKLNRRKSCEDFPAFPTIGRSLIVCGLTIALCLGLILVVV